LQCWYWLQDDSHRSFYLSFLRVTISFWLLKELFFNWSSVEFLYGSKAFVTLKDYGVNQLFYFDTNSLREHYLILLIVYLLLIFLNIFGIGKWITALLLFICYDILQRENLYFFSGGERMARLILFYLVFANSYDYFSLFKRRDVSIETRKLNNLLSNLAALAIMLQLCLAYFVSGFSKLDSELWRNGQATYYTLSAERYLGTSFNKQLVQQAWFVYASTYFTLAFELLFPFLIWFKKLRSPFLIMGILLHAGIYIFMMIYGFQIVFLLIYGLFFSNRQTLGLYHKARSLFRRKNVAIPQ
jgi:hypothetical protein